MHQRRYASLSGEAQLGPDQVNVLLLCPILSPPLAPSIRPDSVGNHFLQFAGASVFVSTLCPNVTPATSKVTSTFPLEFLADVVYFSASNPAGPVPDPPDVPGGLRPTSANVYSSPRPQ
jgi:hypothetical protein